MGSLCEATKANSPFSIHMKPDSAIESAAVAFEKPTHTNDRNDQLDEQPMKKCSHYEHQSNLSD